MDDKLLEELDNLTISDIDLLLDKNINLSLDSSTRKRIEQSVNRKTGYYNETNTFLDKINNILGGIFMKRKIAFALSVGAVLSLGGGVYAHAKTTPVAYVSMDINPSVELGVNTFDEVVSAEAYNEDGEKVLEGTNLVNSDINDAVSTVVTNAISEGYIKEDGTSAIEITTATDKENVATELEGALQNAVDETLNDNNVEAEVETENVALARRDEARTLGITPGKLNLIQKLQALDPTIKVEDYKSSSVKDIKKKTKELRKLNKSDETTNEDTTNTDANSGTSTDADTNTNTGTDVTTEDSTQQEGTVSQSSVVSEKSGAIAPQKNNNSSHEQISNGSVKKEENTNANIQKQENSVKKEEKTSTANEKKDDSSQGNSNSSKSEKSSSSQSNNSKGNGKNK